MKETVRLHSARQRAKQGLFTIQGRREMARAIAAGVRVATLFYLAPGPDDPELAALVAQAAAGGAELLEVSPDVYRKLAYGEVFSGVVAVAETPRRTLAQLALPPDPLIAVVEGLEKPGNVGAILRSADGAGLAAVIVVDGGTDLYNPNTIRASLGTLFTVPCVQARSTETQSWLCAGGFRVLVARVDGAVSYDKARFDGPTAIVLGSEAAGLSESWRGPEMTAIQLPMRGAADSLNVSATAAILFYEAQRQRGAFEA